MERHSERVKKPSKGPSSLEGRDERIQFWCQVLNLEQTRHGTLFQVDTVLSCRQKVISRNDLTPVFVIERSKTDVSILTLTL